MGMETLKTALIGLGFGMIAISGLISAGLFGQYYDNTKDDLTKRNLNYKGNFDGLRDCSVAITVLGSIAAIAAIATIVLAIFMEDQALILIIVGGVASLISLGCVIAEGVYTKKSVDYNVDVSTYDDREHIDQKNYIKESIKILLEQGRNNLLYLYPNMKLATTDEVLNHLGKVLNDQEINNQEIFTYQYLWTTNLNSYPATLPNHHFGGNDFVVLYMNYKKEIYAIPYSKIHTGSNSNFMVNVASLNFISDSTKVTPKERVCWPDDMNKYYTDFQCKMIDLETIKLHKVYTLSYHDKIEYPIFLNEKIVVGNYSPNENAIDYSVDNFPAMFHLITKGDIDNYNNKVRYAFDFSDSDRSFGATGAEFAKTCFEHDLDIFKNGDEDNAIIVPKNVNNFDEFANECKKYFNGVNKGDYKRWDEMCEFKGYKYDPNDFVKDFFKDEDQFSSRSKTEYKKYIQKHYYYGNEGKKYPGYTDDDKQEAKDGIKELPKNEGFYEPLYTTALIHLIVQCIGIAIGVVGVVLGFVLGGKSPVEFEP